MFLDDVVNTCHNNLMSKSAKLPLSYLTSRSVSFDEIKKHKIGYLGNVFSNVPETCEDSKTFNEWMGHKGRAVTNRIVFPIYDELGQVKGIETRALDKKATDILKPEYKEKLKETIARLPDSSNRYKKFYLKKYKLSSAFFFGLPGALDTIWKEKTIFLTEGIFDAISLLKIKQNCISSLTANLNERQIDWLKRYATKLIFLFDMDEKGKKAVKKFQEVLEKDMMVYSISLKGKDVNEFLISYGEQELKNLIQEKLKFFY